MLKDLTIVLVKVLTLLLVGYFFAVVVGKGLDRQASVTCKNFQFQATEYPGFYLTSDEALMCNSVGVHVDAPIHIKNYAR